MIEILIFSCHFEHDRSLDGMRRQQREVRRSHRLKLLFALDEAVKASVFVEGLNHLLESTFMCL